METTNRLDRLCTRQAPREDGFKGIEGAQVIVK